MRVARIARPQGHQALGTLVLAVLVEPHVPTRRALLAHLPIGTSKAPRGGGTLQTSASLLDGLQQMPLGCVRSHRLRRPCFVRVAHVIPRRLVGHNDPWPSHDNRAAARRPEKWARVERRLGWPAKHRDTHHFVAFFSRSSRTYSARHETAPLQCRGSPCLGVLKISTVLGGPACER